MVKKDNEVTANFIKDFEELCEKYAFEDINTKKLRKEISDVIDNYT
jgi:hypothetical protein